MATKKQKAEWAEARARREAEEARLESMRQAEQALQRRQAEWWWEQINMKVRELAEADRDEMLDVVDRLGIPATPPPSWRTKAEREVDEYRRRAEELEREAAELRARIPRGAR